MITPIKLMWALDGLRTRLTDIRASVERRDVDQPSVLDDLAHADKFLDSIVGWTAQMQGEQAPPTRAGYNTMFQVTFDDGYRKVFYTKEQMRRFFEKHQTSKPARVMRSDYSWQHSTLAEMLEYSARPQVTVCKWCSEEFITQAGSTKDSCEYCHALHALEEE